MRFSPPRAQDPGGAGPDAGRGGSGSDPGGPLSERQSAVLRAVVSAYVGQAAPVGSETLSHLLPVPLSSASIRNTLGELAAKGLVEKPHASAGRVPTERGVRVFVDQLLDPATLGDWEMRSLAYPVEEAHADSVTFVASQLLSEQTRLLGFVVAPRLDRVPMRHVSLVRLSSERILVVLVTHSGASHRRVVEYTRDVSQADLDAIASLLNERAAGHTLREVRDLLAQEARALRRRARALRRRADRLSRRAVELGLLALAPEDAASLDLVVASRLGLLDQPEFRDPERLRAVLEALEARERLVAVLSEVIRGEGVTVALGEDVPARWWPAPTAPAPRRWGSWA